MVTTAHLQTLLPQDRSIYEQSTNSQAIAIYNLAGEIDNQLDDKKGTVTALRGIGNIYIRQRSYSQALEYCKRSLKLAEEIGDKAGISYALGNIGLIHQYQGNYTQAI